MKKFLNDVVSVFQLGARSAVKTFLGHTQEGFRFGAYSDSVREALFVSSAREEIFERFMLVGGLLWLLYLVSSLVTYYFLPSPSSIYLAVVFLTLFISLFFFRRPTGHRFSGMKRQVACVFVFNQGLFAQFLMTPFPYNQVFLFAQILVSIQVLEALRLGLSRSLWLTYFQFILVFIAGATFIKQKGLDDIALVDFYITMVAWFIVLLTGTFNLVRREIRYRTSFSSQELAKNQHNQLSLQKRELEQLVTSDPLTGLFNRRGFEAHFLMEWRRACRQNYHLLLLYVDIDFFKAYNDFYGHEAGDEALIQVSSLLNQSARRSGEFVCRYGGEEFLLCYPLPGNEKPTPILSRVLEAVSQANIPHEKSPLDKMTVSIGGVFFNPSLSQIEDEMREKVRQADDMLYRAKSEGRNRFFLDDQISEKRYGSQLFE